MLHTVLRPRWRPFLWILAAGIWSLLIWQTAQYSAHVRHRELRLTNSAGDQHVYQWDARTGRGWHFWLEHNGSNGREPWNATENHSVEINR